jgi:hypothetical protein
MAKIPILTLDADMPEVISGVVHFSVSVLEILFRPQYPIHASHCGWFLTRSRKEESRAGILILLLKHPARLLGTNLLALSTNRCFHAEG